jgi:hypothetical protein
MEDTANAKNLRIKITNSSATLAACGHLGFLWDLEFWDLGFASPS